MTESNVVGIHGNTPIGLFIADEDVIACLEELLERARNGEIVNIVTIAIENNGAFEYRRANSNEPLKMIGATTLALQRLTEHYLKG